MKTGGAGARRGGSGMALRCTMHKAHADDPAGARRFMHRIVVEGTTPA